MNQTGSASTIAEMQAIRLTACEMIVPSARYCPKTRAYVVRRTSEGKTKKEIIRCLKRYIAREVHASLHDDLGHCLPPLDIYRNVLAWLNRHPAQSGGQSQRLRLKVETLS